MPRVAATPEDYIAERIRKCPSTGCWNWTGYISNMGYGRATIGGRGSRQQMAHRVVWELSRGPVANGLDLDHLCRNKACVNPDHLEPVSHRTNVLRGEGPSALLARMTHCSKGHELAGTNLYHPPGAPTQRLCRACRTEARSTPEYRAKNRAAQAERRKRSKG